MNSKVEQVPANQILEEYLTGRGMDNSRGTAVAVNNCVIARNEWRGCVLHENDKILIIHATQGG